MHVTSRQDTLQDFFEAIAEMLVLVVWTGKPTLGSINAVNNQQVILNQASMFNQNTFEHRTQTADNKLHEE